MGRKEEKEDVGGGREGMKVGEGGKEEMKGEKKIRC